MRPRARPFGDRLEAGLHRRLPTWHRSPARSQSYHIDGDLKKTLMSFSQSRPVVAAYALGVTRAAMDFAWARLGEIGIVPDDNATITQRSAAADRMLALEFGVGTPRGAKDLHIVADPNDRERLLLVLTVRSREQSNDHFTSTPAVCGAMVRRCRCRRAAGCRPRLSPSRHLKVSELVGSARDRPAH